MKRTLETNDLVWIGLADLAYNIIVVVTKRKRSIVNKSLQEVVCHVPSVFIVLIVLNTPFNPIEYLRQ